MSTRTPSGTRTGTATRSGALAVHPVDPLDPAQSEVLDEWVAVTEASERQVSGEWHTAYSRREVVAMVRGASTERHLLLAADGPDGRVAATGWLSLPVKDNLHAAFGDVAVHPAARRRGLGTAVLAELERLALLEGRRTLCIESTCPLGATDVAAAFARARGYDEALGDLRSDLSLPQGAGSLDDVLAAVEAEAGAPEGYELLTWWDDVPEEHREGRAVLAGRMVTDAPMGDLDIEPEVWDGERVREQLQVLRDQGRRAVETVARHRASGELVAFTTLVVPEHEPRLAFQWDTLVLRGHRGHRLGMAVKARNLRALLAGLPQVRRVATWNAEVNAPMLRVNRAMGFQSVARLTEWQKRL